MADKRVWKTGKKLSGGPTTFRKWDDWEEGDYVIGAYKGTRMNKFKKEDTLIEVLDASFGDKKAAKALIGKTIALNPAGQLDKARSSMEENSVYQITYNGKSVMQGGPYAGKESHLIGVAEASEEGDEDQEIDDTEVQEDEEEEFDV